MKGWPKKIGIWEKRFGKRGRILSAILISTAIATAPAESATFWKLPEIAPPHQFGDILIDRLSTKNGMNPVHFSHWKHRTKYTCRVCHWELDFAFETGGTEITEADNLNGLFCGKCHDGWTAFGHTDDNCTRCHTGKNVSDRDKFKELQFELQSAKFGNKINWTAALKTGRISPAYSIYRKEEPLNFRKELWLKAEWLFVPPAYFPHETHVEWLDCGDCHPDIFNIRKKSTKHFEMKFILEEKFCGVCHLKVAFPIDNCQRCHPAMKATN
ncbi:MAG: hypothetical protein LC633_04055 [Desulfobulbaceae bacterium]|nr:hypothetical protein [Desulfobulbaceae bacterium]